jgi:molybdate transport system ATP-binding protein
VSEAAALEVDVALRRGAFALAAAFRAGPGVTVLTGPSGGGKSSLAAAIAGLVRPDSGRIAVGETVLFDARAGVDVPVAARRIGYVLQDALLFPHLSVRGNLTYSRRGGPLSLERVTEILGIASLLDRRPSTLSGGERQRVAIGRALLSGPALLLMDEPLASLDAPRRAELLPFIESLRDLLGLPIVYVTHHWPEIVRLADTLVILAGGGVLAAGSLQAVLTEDDPALAGLVPEGSVLEAASTGERIDGLERFETPAGPLFLPPGHGAGRLRLFVDAHDVAIAVRPPEGLSVQNVLPGTIARLSAHDAYLDLLLALQGGQRLRARITRHAGELLGLRPGMPVHALVKSVSFDRRLASAGLG